MNLNGSRFVRCIYLNSIPLDVNYVLANLHSYAHESTTNLSQPDESDLVLAQQEDILKEDDLIDDDDDNW